MCIVVSGVRVCESPGSDCAVPKVYALRTGKSCLTRVFCKLCITLLCNRTSCEYKLREIEIVERHVELVTHEYARVPKKLRNHACATPTKCANAD